MRSHAPILLLLTATLLLCGPPSARSDEPVDDAPFVQYRTSTEVAEELERLAESAGRGGLPGEVHRYGTSGGGRPLLVLRLGRSAPGVLVHGGLGRRDAAATVACLDLARHLAAAPEAAGGLSWLIVPAPNPDALDAFLAGERPAAGGGLVDRDRDGRLGEDGPADVDGDGEILRMRRRAPGGTWAVAASPLAGEGGTVRGDERLLEEQGADSRRDASYEVWDEGLDEDGDGDVNEDPPGLDLTRQLAGWWDDKAPWRGAGPFPGFAPEARALMELSFAEAGLIAWYGFTGTGPSILRASEQGKAADADDKLYERIAARLKESSGLATKKASQVLARERNPGSDLDWAAVHLGIPALRIPVWWIDKEQANARKREVADELDWLLWSDRVLGGKGFVPWRTFDHPTLGAVEIGGWKRFTRHEPPPAYLAAAVAKVALAPLAHVGLQPVLEADVEVTAKGVGVYELTLRVLNRGEGPTDTRVAEKHRLSVRIRVEFDTVDGTTLLAGDAKRTVGRLDAGQISAPIRWLVARATAGPLGRVRLHHPKAKPAVREVATP